MKKLKDKINFILWVWNIIHEIPNESKIENTVNCHQSNVIKQNLKRLKKQKFFLQFSKSTSAMFEQYCIPQLLLSSVSLQDLEDEIQPSPQIKELLQVQKQTELIQKIFSKMTHHPTSSITEETIEGQTESELQTSIMRRNESTISIYSLSCDLVNFTFNHQDRVKFGSNGSKCLKEVKEKCSLQTYQYLSKIVQENRKNARSSNLRQKNQQRINFLEEQKLILQHQLQKEKLSIEDFKAKVLKLTRENMEISKKIMQINGDEKRILRKEESLLYQRKICSSLQKQIRQEMMRLEQLCGTVQGKVDKSFGSNPEGSGDEGLEQKDQNCSRSTIDYQNQKPEIMELWKLVNRLEEISGMAN